jgi:hypothetical protein
MKTLAIIAAALAIATSAQARLGADAPTANRIYGPWTKGGTMVLEGQKVAFEDRAKGDVGARVFWRDSRVIKVSITHPAPISEVEFWKIVDDSRGRSMWDRTAKPDELGAPVYHRRDGKATARWSLDRTTVTLEETE